GPGKGTQSHCPPPPSETGSQPHSQSQSVEAWKKDPHNLVMDLERSLKFLQQQHAETLMKLHEEIEYLKRENKDRGGQTMGRIQPTSCFNLALGCWGAESGACPTLTFNPFPMCFIPCDQFSREDREISDKITSPVLSLPCQIKSEQAQVPPASSNPFLVSVLPSHIRKPPTLEECEIVIHQLWNINHMQAQEVRLFSQGIISAIIFSFRNQEVSRLPKMLKGTSKKCLILTPLPAAERAVLPALKQTLGNSFAERQKRTQAIQRSRLRRTVL
uniref:Coiled-coil domain-containing protein 74B n=1 Tax=Gopherus evgoodei TaxID=1825980 RepID=A0A8C4VRB4_9SAUR